jgi:hypothetical protein
VGTSETSVAQDTATRVTESSAVHTAESAADEETSAAGIVGPLGGSTSTAQASATSAPLGASPSASETAAPDATTTGVPVGASPSTIETASTTRYVTKFVTRFTTLCEASAATPAIVAEKPATTEVLASAHSQVPSAQASHVAETSVEQQGGETAGVVGAITTPVATQGAQTAAAASNVPNAGSSADAASEVASESASTQALPTVIPGPAYGLGSASPLPSGDSPETSKPVNPAPTGSSAPSGTVFAGSSSTGYSPVFTGAADRVSVKFTTFAAAFAFAFFA